MKKIFIALLSLAVVFIFAACDNGTPEPQIIDPIAAETKSSIEDMGKAFSGIVDKGTASTDYTDEQIITLLGNDYTADDLYANLGEPATAVSEVAMFGKDFTENEILEISFGNNAMYQAVVWKMSGKDLLVNKAVLYASLLNGKGFEINGQDYAFEYDVTAEATEITLTTQQGSVPATTAGGEKLLSGLSMSSFRSRDEEEIAGYADALNIIQRNYESIPLTENYIKQLHAVLLKYSKHDERHRDEYKTLSDSVAAFDGDGNEVGIVFHTAEPYETPILMENLVNETNELLNDKTFEPLIVIALFIVHFLAIHPFQDGNGRMSRLLTMLLLLKCGYAYVPYYSLEKLIEESKSSYYQGLRRTQLSFSSDKADYSPWLEYFLDILRLQTENLEKKIEAYVSDHSLSMNEESVVSVLKEGGQSFAAICSKLPDLKPNTVKGILRKLCAAGIAEKHGVNKGTWYGIRRK